MALKFQDIFMKFSSYGKDIEFRGIQGKPSKVIISNSMTKSLKNGHQGVIAQSCSIDVQTSISSYLLLSIMILHTLLQWISKNLSKIIPRYLQRCIRVFYLLKIMPMLFILNQEVYIQSSMFLS